MSNKNILGIISKKRDNFSEWYIEVLIKSQMLDYGEISGCYIMLPKSYYVWEQLQQYMNEKFSHLNVQNAYFPLFVKATTLECEKSHIEGFAPEVAWVTEAGNSKLEEKIAIRPTSETIIYPYYSKIIRSWRDLPLKMNQWCNIIRYEFKDCTPFIRSREFLWQEGHTCFATQAEADAEVLAILDIYTDVYRDMLSIPVIPGKKSNGEKFPGALYTTTIECFIPVSNKAIQAATSHNLGQKFSNIFNIKFIDNNSEQQKVWQNSWGFTTRSIGIAIMTHSDDRGLILPPRVANIKVVVIPCGISSSTPASVSSSVFTMCENITATLNTHGIKCLFDNDTNHTIGFKINHHELNGVPIRIEIGAREIQNNEAKICLRHNGQKHVVSLSNILDNVRNFMNIIHNDLYDTARNNMYSNIRVCHDMKEMITNITQKYICLVPWCCNNDCENKIVNDLKLNNINAKSLCIPFDQTILSEFKLPNPKCVHDGCDECVMNYALFGSSY